MLHLDCYYFLSCSHRASWKDKTQGIYTSASNPWCRVRPTDLKRLRDYSGVQHATTACKLSLFSYYILAILYPAYRNSLSFGWSLVTPTMITKHFTLLLKLEWNCNFQLKVAFKLTIQKPLNLSFIQHCFISCCPVCM